MILPSPRSALLVPLALAASVMLASTSGCTAPPEPEPTPTPLFATDEEAFVAAEEVYREYIRAGDQGKDTSAYLVGSALEDELETARYLDERGLSFTGETLVASFKGTRAKLRSLTPTVNALVCLDASATRVIDDAGADVTPPDRAARVALNVSFSWDVEAFAISRSQTTEESAC
ncbi:hypothetical protein [uncultured Microbacterium sp.]|uniref:hypothetical protein n=1 Tax=uncultured Microbacterium sp. TaxID=191216 RepID=UPI0028DB8DD8|nr:hypothetical protein [uncultured Microbacterium sp.]